jgi:hypothetical protein
MIATRSFNLTAGLPPCAAVPIIQCPADGGSTLSASFTLRHQEAEPRSRSILLRRRLPLEQCKVMIDAIAVAN